MNIDELTIGELKKIAALAGNLNGASCASAKPEHADGHKQIVVLQRGWVMVGDFYQSGDECRLENASVIRQWGTTKGLGELVNGPLKDTKLDPCGTARFNALTIVHRLDVNGEKWK